MLFIIYTFVRLSSSSLVILAEFKCNSIYAAEFKSAYPDAKLIGVPAHLSKPNLKGLKFDGGKDK